ncbi:5-hydroxytryptamine receptor 7 [Phycodurus eques]|uniref:5-hydroxytryptamine receptor 7 n=1 Tax=Phycodurus eques TaxID=693459 RepID=UPI002ACEDFAD|nr:5-hydroxytryptamine receptor 7 [Phycodurus eques]
MRNESCGEQLLVFRRPEKIIIGVMLAIITAVTVMGNTLVVIAVCVVKKLRQPSNYLLVSLAVADLSVAIVVMPFVIVTDLTGGKWLFGEVFCNIFIGMDVMCCTASIMTLCVISVDRTFRSYPNEMNKKSTKQSKAKVSWDHTAPNLPCPTEWSADGKDDLGRVVGVSIHHFAPLLRLGQKRPHSRRVPHQPRLWLHHLFHSRSLLHPYAGNAVYVLQNIPGSPQEWCQTSLH